MSPNAIRSYYADRSLYIRRYNVPRNGSCKFLFKCKKDIKEVYILERRLRFGSEKVSVPNWNILKTHVCVLFFYQFCFYVTRDTKVRWSETKFTSVVIKNHNIM